MFNSKLYIVIAILFMLALVVGACAQPALTPPATGTLVTLEDTVWVLQSYGELGNSKDILTDTEITAEFVSSEATVRGTAGCNSYFGSYEVEDSQLLIPGPIGSTEMYCMEPEGIMEQEQQYLTILQSADSYEINGNEFRVNCGSQVLVFKHTEPEIKNAADA